MLNAESNLSRFRQWAKRLMASPPDRKRTEIVIETDQILIIRRRGVMRAWCPECGGETEMGVVEEATGLGGMPEHVWRGMTRANGWHVVQGQDGTRLICLNSMDSK
jgi:hypothetical protein